MIDILREPPLCACGYNERWCCCPPPAQPARPLWRESYPPLYCAICAAPYFAMVHRHEGFPHRACGDDCAKELERRYYAGTILHRPYERKAP